MPTETSCSSVVAHYAARSPRARQILAGWRSKEGKDEVWASAQALTSRAIYALTPDDVLRACASTRHALTWPPEEGGAGLRRSVAEKVGPIADWYPNFPIVHSLYHAVEYLERPPLWDELIELWREYEPLRNMLGLPARRAVNDAIRREYAVRDAHEAMWWRLGNAYYSLLRELYVLAVLREAGVAAEYHVLADALFRVDLWSGDTVISLYVENAQYKSASGAGRKLRAESILGDCPDFSFVQMPRLTRHEYGTVHLPAPDEIRRFAEEHLLPR